MIPGQCDPWPKEKKKLLVLFQDTTSIRLRNKRKEGMKDERHRVRGRNEGKGSKGLWGKMARNKIGL